MKKLLIIQCEIATSPAYKKFGEPEELIIKQIGILPENVIIVHVYKEKISIDAKDISAIIITGSSAMVTDFADWSVSLSRWLREIKDKNIPMLGICFGHQLLAHAFGGVVDYHPKGQEIGTVNIELTDLGQKDTLLEVLPESFIGHEIHEQTVVRLPDNARQLAKNSFDIHQAFALDENIWGVQFHPEYNANIMHAFIEEDKEILLNRGFDIDQLHDFVQENAYGEILLKRFFEICIDKNQL